MFTGNFIEEIAIGSAWSVAITISLIGWGSLLLLLTKQGNRDEWLKATIGLGVFIVISSFLDYKSLANREVLVYMALGGIIFWALTKGPQNLWELTKSSGITGIMLFFVALYIAILGANSWMYDANWDDSSGYWPVCHEMAISGQSWAPLSLRRVLSWGGQYPIQILGMLFTSDMAGYLYDRSVGAWVTLLLTLSALKGRESSGWTPLAGIGMILLPQTALNSAPTVTSALLFAAMYVERKSIIPCAILMASTALTRSQLILPAGLVGLLGVYEIWKANKNILSTLRYSILTPLLTILFCVPAMLLHKEMYNTFTVFLDSGTLNKDYISFTNYKENLKGNTWDVIVICSTNLAIIFGCITLGLGRKISWIAAITLLFMIASMPEYSWIEFRRYSWPVISAALWIAVIYNWNTKNQAILTIMLLSVINYPLNTLTSYTKKASIAMRETSEGNYPWQEITSAQGQIPEGKTILYVGNQPALLQYSRNKIVNWDSFPAVGNPPETNNTNEWRKWASKFGAEYLVHIDFEAVYANGKSVRDLWVEPFIAGGGNLPHYQRVWYPDRTKYINVLKSLQETFPYIKSNRHVIIDLRPEGSPYELNKDPLEVEEDLAFEKEDREFVKDYENIKKGMEEKKVERNKEREELRAKNRRERERNKAQSSNP
jgi:hypothetical protein